MTSSTESGIEIIKDKTESLQGVVEKILSISNAMSNSLSKSDPLDRTRDAEQNDQVKGLRNELMELERERDVFRITCEHSEEKQQVCNPVSRIIPACYYEMNWKFMIKVGNNFLKTLQMCH